MEHRLLFQKIFPIALSEFFSSRLLFQILDCSFRKFFCERGDPLEKIFCITFSGVSETRKDENNLQLHHRI
jgi:hypothetical protein